MSTLHPRYPTPIPHTCDGYTTWSGRKKEDLDVNALVHLLKVRSKIERGGEDGEVAMMYGWLMSFFRDRLNFFVIGLWKNGTPFKVPVRFSMFFFGYIGDYFGMFPHRDAGECWSAIVEKTIASWFRIKISKSTGEVVNKKPLIFFSYCWWRSSSNTWDVHTYYVWSLKDHLKDAKMQLTSIGVEFRSPTKTPLPL